MDILKGKNKNSVVNKNRFILRICFAMISCLFFSFSFSQEISFHKKRIKESKEDTVVINSYNYLAEYYLYENNDSAEYFCKKSIGYSTAKNLKDKNFKGYYLKAYVTLANGEYNRALSELKTASEISIRTKNTSDNIDAEILRGIILQQAKKGRLALESYLKAYQIGKENVDQEGILKSGIYLGLYYKDINENTEALKYYLEVYPIAIQLKDTGSIFNCCINIGTLYERTSDAQKGLKFYRHALNINRADEDENGQAICYFKIGRLFAGLNKNDSAEYYLKKTMDIHLKRKDEVGLIFDYSFLGSLNAKQKKYKLAEENYDQSLQLAMKIQDSLRISMVYDYKATMYFDKGDFERSLENYLNSLSFITRNMSVETQMKIYERTSRIYKRKGDYQKSLEHYEIYKLLTDSIYNANDIKKQTELKLGFEFEQVESQLKEEAKNKEILRRADEVKRKAEQESERQKRYYLMGGLILVSILLIMAVRNYRSKQRANLVLESQKREIELQKKLVEVKNREISDSINYAHHIQDACLPEKEEMLQWFPNHAIIFKPKDIVSGDFYWAASTEKLSLIAVADCTGHGVPGAITSMIGSMLLNEIFYVKKMTRPDEVLTELNRLVRLTLRQKESSISKDGMDMAFCVWERDTNILRYAGANRPLYLVRNNGVVEEIKPAKISIGGFTSLLENYTLHEIQLERGDKVILTTDGFADQFGGGREKKFTTKLFRKMLEETAGMSVKDQAEEMDKRFSSWQGAFSQTDDVLVILFKI